jgi:hypothetical protein
MRFMKWLGIPLLALAVAPALAGCMVEERYPHAYYAPHYYHPYYRYHGWRPVHRVVIVGQNDAPQPDDAPATTAE